MIFGKARTILALVLLATLLAAYFAPPPTDEGLELTERARVAPARRASSAELRPSRHAAVKPVTVLRIHPGERDEEGEAGTDLLSAVRPALAPAPEIQTQAPAPVAPQAPPLPFQLLGRYDEDGRTIVFLQHGDQNLVARVGDVIADHYRVEGLDDSVLRLRYLPLNQPQTLALGGDN